MPQIINTNVASLNAQRNLNSSQSEQETALQRLSSGLRINSAKDDAAGLSISSRFDAQISGLKVATRNAGDGVSLAQTAEGGLDSITTNLQRLRELAVQSANASNSDVDRAALNSEAQQLIEEIGRVSEQTNFNGVSLLNGDFQGATFQTGANVGETIEVSITSVTNDTLGTAATSGVSSVQSDDSRGAMVQGDLVINGVAVGAADAAADGASTTDQNLSSIAIASAINKVSDDSGVTATVNATSVAGTEVTSVNATAAAITINGTAITVAGSGVAGNLQADLQGVADQINAFSGQTGVTASIDLNNLEQGVTLTAEDGRNISLGGAAATSLGLAATDDYVGSFTLVSKDGSDIEISSNTGNSLDNAGLEIGTYKGNVATAVSDTITGSLSAGDLTINGTSVGATFSSYDTASSANKDESAIAYAAAINLVSDSTGVTATANATQITSTAVTADTAGNFDINGVNVSYAAGTTGTTSEQVALIVDGVNAKSAQTGVTAVVIDDNQFELVASDGRNIVLANTDANDGLTDATTRGTVRLESGGPIEIGTKDPSVDVGFEVGTYGGSEDGQLLKDVDISTVAGAEAAITAVDNALNQVNSVRADLGAIQSRFENVISSNQLAGENLSASNSRIKDADFAEETAALSRSQVLQQAGISVLAQANGRPQQVLSLLQ